MPLLYFGLGLGLLWKTKQAFSFKMWCIQLSQISARDTTFANEEEQVVDKPLVLHDLADSDAPMSAPFLAFAGEEEPIICEPLGIRDLALLQTQPTLAVLEWRGRLTWDRFGRTIEVKT